MEMTTAPSVTMADFEIEEHVAATNKFFQQSRFTLDDMDAYAQAFGPLLSAAYDAKEGRITREQAAQVLMSAIDELTTIDAGLDQEYAAA